ncbi:N-acetylglucosamine-1-phosphodiester alpha-N-acetylglucosaminidase [Discoglossus pictus]
MAASGKKVLQRAVETELLRHYHAQATERSRSTGETRWRPSSSVLSLLVLLHCWLRVSASDSIVDDLLLPYPPFSHHGPRHSHRSVRECQPVIYGNITHEEWSSDRNKLLPLITTKIFEHKIGDKIAYGHLTFISNPLKTFSVLEPREPGGCKNNITETVQETTKNKKCIVAQNGGFFDVKYRSCLGNVVSDGTLIQNSKGIQNAQFGIKADGTLVFGYLSEEQVLDEKNPFVQLVSGVVWLLRDGNVYIEESKTAECDDAQTTGTLETFINVDSARTGVGHDKEGRLILFHVEGKTRERGLNLFEMANFLKDHGVINAINLDGGGSATLVMNGTLIGYPSDLCDVGDIWHCARKISTVVCVHEPYCDPPDCGGHGQCVMGECQCTGNWSGPTCNVLNCGHESCNGHGNCTESGCICDAGWEGSSCRNACAPGFFGNRCSSKCNCQNNGTCDHVSGTCECLAGYKGEFCEQACPLGFYGSQCQKKCQCDKQCYCHQVTGICNITKDFQANGRLSTVGQCLESLMHTSIQSDNKMSFLSEPTWIIISSVLALLLAISIAVNIQQMTSCTEKGADGVYSYQQLEEMHGDMDTTETNDLWDLQQLERNIESE